MELPQPGPSHPCGHGCGKVMGQRVLQPCCEFFMLCADTQRHFVMGDHPGTLQHWTSFLSFVHITCMCVKVVFSKTSLFIDDVIVIVLFFWLINCLLSLLCMPASISHTSSWKGCEETSN